MAQIQDVASSTDRCLRALHHHHLLRASSKSYTPSDPSNPDLFEVCELQVADAFAQQASKELNAQEIDQLESFLLRPPQSVKNGDGLKNQVEKMLAQFYAAEVTESGEERSRLARPSGHENAEIGILMHLQTKKGDIGGFWDMGSPSIQALAVKGFSENEIFGFDWHWRAEESCRGRGPCPTTKWSPVVKHLHDKLSSDILVVLPLPLLIVAGRCPREEYRKTLSASARQLTIDMGSDILLFFLLDFQDERLRRIVAYIDHPASILFGRAPRPKGPQCLDATLNFFLWLNGKPHDSLSFCRRYGRFGKGLPPLTAPIVELDEIMEKESNENRVCGEHEYSRDLRAWAEGFLNVCPGNLIDRGVSLAAAVKENLLTEAKYLPGNAKKMPDLRKRLLNNGPFSCSHMSHKSGFFQYRIYFRGVAIHIPTDAISGDVQVKCDLAAEGVDHAHRCAKDALQGDPAGRLGIMVTYRSRPKGEETCMWYSQKGAKNVKKLNSLVDFLEGKDDAYTRKQSRRFLDRNATFGRYSISYT